MAAAGTVVAALTPAMVVVAAVTAGAVAAEAATAGPAATGAEATEESMGAQHLPPRMDVLPLCLWGCWIFWMIGVKYYPVNIV